MPPTPDSPLPDPSERGDSKPDTRAPADPRSSFAHRVYSVVRRIPEGRVTSYGAVAALVGSPRAARGVGAALNGLLPADDGVPWWRVVNRRGALSIPADLGLRALQRTLLESEGVAFLESGEVDLDRHLWGGIDGEEEE